MNSTHNQLKTVVFVFISLNIMLAIVCFLLIGSNPVYAQDDDKGEPVPENGVRFDAYPHPLSTGALAYSIADRWDYTDLTYSFGNCPAALSCDDGQYAVRTAFQAWAEVSPLTFTEVSNANDADIEVSWSNQGPDLGYPGDILAYATFPSDGGDVFFDDSEPWSLFDGSEFDLVLVATHEIGHAVGLDHSSDPGALMYPVHTDQTYGLSPDDTAAIQALYGAPENPSHDLPEDTETDQVNSEITDDFPYELWDFEAYAGETLTITMEATSGNLSPYLGLLTDDEETVLAESGQLSGDFAQITYTFEDGFYVVMATRDGVEEGSTTGSYTLTFELGEASTPTEPTSNGDTVLVDISSYSSIDSCEIYFNSSDIDDWGTNLLDFTLTYGNYIGLEVTPGTYDILAVGCDGSWLEFYEIEVQQDLAIEIYDDDINVFVYGD